MLEKNADIVKFCKGDRCDLYIVLELVIVLHDDAIVGHARTLLSRHASLNAHLGSRCVATPQALRETARLLHTSEDSADIAQFCKRDRCAFYVAWELVTVPHDDAARELLIRSKQR